MTCNNSRFDIQKYIFSNREIFYGGWARAAYIVGRIEEIENMDMSRRDIINALEKTLDENHEGHYSIAEAYTYLREDIYELLSKLRGDDE
jgi:hypothetical protein